MCCIRTELMIYIQPKISKLFIELNCGMNYFGKILCFANDDVWCQIIVNGYCYEGYNQLYIATAVYSNGHCVVHQNH